MATSWTWEVAMVLETVWREVSTVQVTGRGYWLGKEGTGGGKDDPWASRL